MLLFVVARARLDRYEELRRQFEDSRDVRIVLDRRRRTERRQSDVDRVAFVKLGWSVVDTDERHQ